MKLSFQEDIAPFIYKLEKLLGLSLKVFLATALIVMVLGVYIANLLFGDNSLKVLEELKHEKLVLTQEIQELKEENAQLHKKYLEWSDAQE
jgi:cell division protein FtsB